VFKIGLQENFFKVGLKGKDMLMDRIFTLLLNRFNFKIVSLPMKLLIQSPTDILITYLSVKLGMDKIIIVLILAFLI
jgi:hypothetical protein